MKRLRQKSWLPEKVNKVLVVIDTNILVSALWSRDGSPARVLSMVLSGNLIPCYDHRIIEEYVQVLSRPKFGFSKTEIDAIIQYIQDSGLPIIADHISEPFIDEDDKKFYEVALTSNAKLITGNLKHFPENPLVMNAKDFLTGLDF